MTVDTTSLAKDDFRALRLEFESARQPAFEAALFLWFPDSASARGRSLALFRWLGRYLSVRVPEGLSFSAGRGLFSRKASPQRWRLAFAAMGPAEVYRTLTESLVTPNAMRISITKSAVVTYHLVLYRAKEPVGYARRVLHPHEKYAYHDLLMIEPGFRGCNLAALVLRNAVRLYLQLGITEIRIIAGLSSGSAVWPKFGFRPSEPEWRRIRHQMLGQLSNLRCEAATRDRIERVLRIDEPRAIWILRDIREGAELLNGLRWNGILELGDEEAVVQLRTYLKRKQLPL